MSRKNPIANSGQHSYGGGIVTDDPRANLEKLIRENGHDFAALSKMLGKNPAYIQQFSSGNLFGAARRRSWMRMTGADWQNFTGSTKVCWVHPQRASLPARVAKPPMGCFESSNCRSVLRQVPDHWRMTNMPNPWVSRPNGSGGSAPIPPIFR